MIEYTELKNYKRHNLIDVIPLNKPFTLLIEPSNLCNFKCIQCFQSIISESYLTRNKGLMDIGLYTEIINQFKEWDGNKLKVLKLGIYGEPFSNPDFCEMLKIARRANIAERIETTTNASLMTEEVSKNLVEYGIDYIRISIYSVNQKKHENITNSKINIENIYENIKFIQEFKRKIGATKPFISVKMLDTYSEENENFLNKYKDIADEVYIDKPHNWIAHEEKSFIGSLYDETNEAKLNEDLKNTRSDRITCPMPFTTIAIRNNGDVSPCCVDWLGGTNLASIKKENIIDIWNGEALYQFRKMQLEDRRWENSSCSKCELVSNDYYTRDNIDGFPVEKLR